MLRLTELRKSFGDVRAVDGLGLDIAAGEIFGLLGPNGAGKTTTVHMVVGFVKPDAGAIDIGGKGAPTSKSVRAQIGIAPQALALYEELTADENLRFFGAIHGVRGEALGRRMAEVLEAVGLTERRGDRVGTYSGGMKRRLNIATALIHEPALLILDEPTAGVDPQSRNAILETIESLRDSGVTVVYTTHYMEEAERVCDRVAIVDAGSVLATGTVDELIGEHGGPSTLVAELEEETVRLETSEPLRELNRIAADRSIVRFHLERPTLERVFLNLTGKTLRD